MSISLLNVNVTSLSKAKILEQIASLKSDSKFGLLGLYSEFFLRARKNPEYLSTLNADKNLQILDGHGAFWAVYLISQKRFLPNLYHQLFSQSKFFSSFFLWLFLIPELVFTFVSGINILILNQPKRVVESGKKLPVKIQSTWNKYSIVLGRELVYDLLNLASEKKWKTLVVGASSNPIKFKENLQKHFSKNQLEFEMYSPNSDLMRDKGAKKEILSIQNLLVLFPDLKSSVTKIRQIKPDLIVLCLGGGSGKQEIFAQYLKEQEGLQFRLVASLGAALDHLGAGNSQKPSPRWLTSMGLEWLYRLIVVPNRRGRVIMAILKFWFFTTRWQFEKKF